jgi:hypothetical protein
MTQALRKPNLFIIGSMKSGLSLRKGEDCYLSLFEQEHSLHQAGPHWHPWDRSSASVEAAAEGA